MKAIINLLVLLFVVNLFSQTNITQAEYYFDTDPGFGSANVVTVTAGNTLNLINYAIVAQNLPEGIHFLYIRCKDANNKWSIATRKVIYTQPNLNNSSPIVAAEYYFDTDPGFGNANVVTITSGNTVSLTNYAIVTQNLSEGIHFLYIRCKDANNKWSIATRKVLYMHPNLNNSTPIVQAEYYIDTDPGIGLGNDIVVTAGTTVQQSFTVATNSLSIGNHFLYVRVKNQNDTWSIVSKQLFTLTEALSVNENSFNEAVVYPNPTTGVFNIKVSNDETIQAVEIVDILGKKVATITENTSQIDISHLPSGTYILKILNGDYKYSQKIIKQ